MSLSHAFDVPAGTSTVKVEGRLNPFVTSGTCHNWAVQPHTTAMWVPAA